MTNHEILNNGPEGWTHVEYCEGLHTYLLVNGYGWHEWENEDWIFIPNSINDFAHIRSRADIERIKELEQERDKWERSSKGLERTAARLIEQLRQKAEDE